MAQQNNEVPDQELKTMARRIQECIRQTAQDCPTLNSQPITTALVVMNVAVTMIINAVSAEAVFNRQAFDRLLDRVVKDVRGFALRAADYRRSRSAPTSMK